MAENREDRSREDLTEEASPFRIEEYRKKGIVSQSKEISGFMALTAVSVTAYVMSPKIGFDVAEFMKEVFRTDLSSRMDLGATHAVAGYFVKALGIMVSAGLPICGAGFLIGALGSFVQIGGIFSVEPIIPDFDKINPIQGFRRLFSLRQLIEAVRLVVKVAIVLFVAYALMKTRLVTAPSYFWSEPIHLLVSYGDTARVTFFSLIGILAVFSGIDFGLQRNEYLKNLRMTKQESKQEHKEREGDPQIRARIRATQRELARKRMMQAVRKADVVVTNPTHIAVALSYDKSKMSAPKVVAKGADLIAQKIKQIASEAGVPMVENVPLARTLFKSVKVGQKIPRALYQAVAEVLAYVYRLRKRDL